MSSNKWLPILMLALGVAVVSFLFIDNYIPINGILWNIMHGEIPLVTSSFEDCFPTWEGPKQIENPNCRNFAIEYKWIAALCIAMAGYAVYLRITKQ